MPQASPSEPETGGSLLVRALLSHGVSTIFGIPGIQLDPLFDALYHVQDEIEVVVPRHEQSTSYMADGYARVTGLPGVGLVVPGPGLLNALSGLATAYATHSPVLMLAGQVATDAIGSGRGVLHEIRDQSAVAEGVVGWVERAREPEEIPDLVARAFEYMTAPGGGPAVLELPADVLAARVTAAVPEAGSHDESCAKPDPDDIESAVRALLASERPMILAGGGAVSAGARQALRELSERLRAPVIMSENAKGALPAAHPLAFERTAFGYLRDRADAVLIVGSRARTQSSGGLVTLPQRVIRIDIDPRRSQHEYGRGVGVTGDAAEALGLILEGIRTADEDGSAEPKEGLGHSVLEACRAEVAERLTAIAPQLELLSAIRTAVSPGTTIVAEYTQLGYAASIGMSVDQPREFVWPGYQGTLGYGFATALGAARGRGEPVVCVTGDGGFSWTLSDLSTAAKYRLPLITIVVNDGYYGNVRRIQKEVFGARYIATELHNPDYQHLAEAFGIPSARVRGAGELHSAVKAASDSGGPWLIELVAGEFPSPWSIPLSD